MLDSELSLDQRDSLVSVQDCANVLLHIINSILDLAKIEAGRIEVEFVTFRMSQLVSSTVRMLHTRASDKNLELVWDLDPDLPQWLIGDYGKLQQCLLNLSKSAFNLLLVFLKSCHVMMTFRLSNFSLAGNSTILVL